MIQLNTIPLDYKLRIETVMKSAWTVFKSQFIHNRHFISTEAPFQHHFAEIIRQVGNLYCLTREDIFLVDMETQCKDIKGKTKYLDISCEFVKKINCAIELKFKKESQGAQDHGRIDIYADIEALELVCNDRFNVGKFYAITDSKPYVNQSKVGVGTVFSTHHGHISEANKDFWFPSKGREHVKVNLKNSYTFNWEKINNWYFLELTVQHLNNDNQLYVG
jgi:hypothetical protein